jgi:hypothetical protein
MGDKAECQDDATVLRDFSGVPGAVFAGEAPPVPRGASRASLRAGCRQGAFLFGRFLSFVSITSVRILSLAAVQ